MLKKIWPFLFVVAILCAGQPLFSGEVSTLMQVLEDANIVKFTDAEKAKIKRGAGNFERRVNALEKKAKSAAKGKKDAVGGDVSERLDKLEEIVAGGSPEKEAVPEHDPGTERIKEIDDRMAENDSKTANYLKAIENGVDIEMLSGKIKALKDANKVLAAEKKKLSAGSKPKEEEKGSRGLLGRVEELETQKAVEISGFVDTSFFSDLNSGDMTFGMDLAEICIDKSFNNKVAASAAIDVENDGAYVRFAFVKIHNVPGGLTFLMGKFDAPIGFELPAAPDMFQYSHALVFDYGIAGSHTGIMLSRKLCSVSDLLVYCVNGWDNNADNNAEKTVGGRLGFTPVESLNIGCSYISGAERDDSADLRNVLDIDLTFTGIRSLTVGGEFNYGAEDGGSVISPGSIAMWSGFLIMAHYDFADWIGLTLRCSQFIDEDGARMDEGIKQTRTEFTVAPTFSIADGLGSLIEYRYDYSNRNVFTSYGGNPCKNSGSLAVEFTYSF